MILGIGTDVVQIKRIQKACQNEKFLQRIYTPGELRRAEALDVARRGAFFANRYAAKEAFVKAVGCGIGASLSWQDIDVSNNENGAPVCTLSKKATAFLCQFFNTNEVKIHLSLSDDQVAVATVVLEK